MKKRSKKEKRVKKKKFKKIFMIFIVIISSWAYLSTNGKIKLFNINYAEKANTLDRNIETLLVNKEHELDKNYIPKNLTFPNISFTDEASQEERHVVDIIREPLENLIREAEKDGIILIGNSGYRSYKSQKNLYYNRVKTDGKEIADLYVSKQGSSEHQTGLAIDITNEDRYFLKGTREAEWLSENCYKFGFILRYPEGKENITNINYEPWHIRYVGIQVAEYIHDNNITLEEYVKER